MELPDTTILCEVCRTVHGLAEKCPTMQPPKSPVEEIGPIVIDRKDEVWLAGRVWSWTTCNHGEGVMSHRFTLEHGGKFVHFFMLEWKTWGEAEEMAAQTKATLDASATG